MTLGEKITALRNEQKISQGDLADQIGVSRQSVSKWETDASVPELDKLVLLSEIFHVTLDELVKKEKTTNRVSTEEHSAESEIPAQPVPVTVQGYISAQRIIGFILLGLGLLCCILAFVFGSGLLIIGGYMVFCGVLYLLLKKCAALIIGWITLIQAMILTPYFTGVRMLSVLNPGYYDHGISMNQIVAIAMWAVLAILVMATIRAIQKRIQG